MLILFAGAGEVLAIIALYLRHAPWHFSPFVLASLLVLTAATLAVSFTSTMRAFAEPPGPGDEDDDTSEWPGPEAD